MSRDVREAQAQLVADVERTWRAWKALIAELDAEVRQQQQRDDDPFVAAAPLTVPKARLPAAQRKQEDEPATLARAIVRDWQRPELRTGQIAHDLLVVAWCCRALIALRRSPRLQRVEVLLEYVSATSAQGQPIQRFDALVLVQVAPAPAGASNPVAIPWGLADRQAPGRLAWTLEVDRGTERLLTLLGKAVLYRDFTVSGHYAATPGCTPLPVVLTPTARRAAQIAREWLDGWPGGRGVVAPLPQLADALGGVLWGRYKTLGLNPARDATLWEDLGLTPAQWAGECGRG